MKQHQPRRFERLYDYPGWVGGYCHRCYQKNLLRYRCFEYPRTRHAGQRRYTHKTLAEGCFCLPCQRKLSKETRMWAEYWLTDELVREVRDEIHNQEKQREQHDQEDWAVAEGTCGFAGGA